MIVKTEDIKIFDTISIAEYEESQRKFKDNFVFKETKSDRFMIIKDRYELPSFDFRMIAQTYYDLYKEDCLLILAKKHENDESIRWELFVSRVPNPFAINHSSRLEFKCSTEKSITESSKFKVETFFKTVMKEKTKVCFISEEEDSLIEFFHSTLNGNFDKYIDNNYSFLSRRDVTKIFNKTKPVETKKDTQKRKIIAFGIFLGGLMTLLFLNSFVVREYENTLIEKYKATKKDSLVLKSEQKKFLKEVSLLNEKLNDSRKVRYDD